jgi:AraC-like DNA-binding protein
VFCERFDQTSPIWNLSEHEHDFIELIYFLGGRANVRGPKNNLSLSVFDAVIYPEHCRHKEDVDLTINQEIVCLGISLTTPSKLEQIIRLPDYENKLRWFFVEIHQMEKSSYPLKYKVLEHLICTLLHYFRYSIDNGIHNNDPLERVVKYLQVNFQKQITIDDLANTANYSSSYLDRRFKERIGMTPIVYLENVRMNAAKILLERQDLDIGQIAEMIGIEDPRYFSRRFSAKFQISPSAYRKQFANKIKDIHNKVAFDH